MERFENGTLTVNRKRYDVSTWSNNGFLFEMLVTDATGGVHYGQPGQVDVIVYDDDDNAIKVECKFFTMGRNAQDKPVYNYANGFDVTDANRGQLLKGLRAYCDTFHKLAVGTGDLLQEETCEIEWFTSDEAYDFLAERLMAMGSQQVRFGYKIDRPNFDSKRRATLAKNGFAL